jgi:hypothetical protein
MWGFLKCNYSYTKILIVLLFSFSRLFFFFFLQVGDSPMPGLPRQRQGLVQEGACRSLLVPIWILCSGGGRGLGSRWPPPYSASQPSQQQMTAKCKTRVLCPTRGAALGRDLRMETLSQSDAARSNGKWAWLPTFPNSFLLPSVQPD